MADAVQWSGNWYIDRRIPLALVGAILVQTGSTFWWASSINERVTGLESWRQDSKDLAADIAVVKSQVSDLKDILRRIEAHMPREAD